MEQRNFLMSALGVGDGVGLGLASGQSAVGKWAGSNQESGRLETDMKVIQFQDKKNRITEVLAANDLVCDDLGSVCEAGIILLSNHIQENIMSAVSFHLMSHNEPEYRNGKLVISSSSLFGGLGLVYSSLSRLLGWVSRTTKDEDSDAAESEAKGGEADAEELVPDNKFEKRIRADVIPPNKIGVTFDDIGAMEEVKESLQELVLLPLNRPDLFKGGLLKPCRGILLFGPPGTGKTMLAKAIANEARASFLNVSMSTITSKWFGEDEKTVRALFTVAAKIAPTIIFIDEVDSMLGQRSSSGETEAMRMIKNEFMIHWEGLMTKTEKQILVLAATNRPFDLDDAIIRRFERRIMVGLPSMENREKILRTLLSKDIVEALDYKELATMTDGYTGSDLKNMCHTAAYLPAREVLQNERKKAMEKKKAKENSCSSSSSSSEVLGNVEEAKEEGKRALNMKDLKWAKSQIASSFAPQGPLMKRLKEWNELYGDGGSRKEEQLNYFI